MSVDAGAVAALLAFKLPDATVIHHSLSRTSDAISTLAAAIRQVEAGHAKEAAATKARFEALEMRVAAMEERTQQALGDVNACNDAMSALEKEMDALAEGRRDDADQLRGDIAAVREDVATVHDTVRRDAFLRSRRAPGAPTDTAPPEGSTRGVDDASVRDDAETAAAQRAALTAKLQSVDDRLFLVEGRAGEALDHCRALRTQVDQHSDLLHSSGAGGTFGAEGVHPDPQRRAPSPETRAATPEVGPDAPDPQGPVVAELRTSVSQCEAALDELQQWMQRTDGRIADLAAIAERPPQVVKPQGRSDTSAGVNPKPAAGDDAGDGMDGAVLRLRSEMADLGRRQDLLAAGSAKALREHEQTLTALHAMVHRRADVEDSPLARRGCLSCDFTTAAEPQDRRPPSAGRKLRGAFAAGSGTVAVEPRSRTLIAAQRM